MLSRTHGITHYSERCDASVAAARGHCHEACDVSMHFPNEGYSRSRGFDPNADVGKWLVLLNTHLPPP